MPNTTLQATLVKRTYSAVRQTSCRHCGQDIQGVAPYRKGEWRDRGNNTQCPYPAEGKIHAPYIDRPKYPGWRTMTRAQRINAKYDAIWEAARLTQTRFNSTSREVS